MRDPVWVVEAHIWFDGFCEYAARERELLEVLGRLQGDSSVVIFFRKTPEYVEVPASFNHMDEKQIDALISFCGRDNVDFVARVSRQHRQVGYLRGITEKEAAEQ